jgi:hypothetical protein
MQWLVRSERTVFKDQWVDLREADVELPDGRHLNHKVLHTAPGAGAVRLRSAQRSNDGRPPHDPGVLGRSWQARTAGIMTDRGHSAPRPPHR